MKCNSSICEMIVSCTFDMLKRMYADLLEPLCFPENTWV